MKKLDFSGALAALALLAACGGGGSPAPAGGGSDTPVTPPPVQADERAAVRGLSCTGPDSSGWCWQDPQPGPQVLDELVFVDARMGYAGGDGGLIVRTTDGGRTWARRGQAGADLLLGLRIDAQGRGWAWNVRGESYRSTDGGALWQGHSPTGLDVMHAWQLADGSLVISTGQVLVGGIPPDLNCQQEAAAARGRPDQPGWQPLALTPLLVTGADTPAPTLHGVAGPCGERWGRSTDLGRSFQPQTDIDPAWRLRAMGNGGQRLWALVARPLADASGNFLGWADHRLLRSDDDGRRWGDPVAMPDDPELDLPGLVLRDGVGALVVGTELLRSLDGGRTWQPVPLPAGSTEPALHSRDWVMVAMADGSARVSSDMGRTWTATAPLPEQPTRLLDVGDGSLAWMSTEQRVRRSVDAGRSFATLPWAPAAPSIRELLFFDTQDGLALTLEGALRRTADGGRQWTAGAPTQRLRGLHATGDGIAWALNGNQLLRSADRGRNWEAQTLPAEVRSTGDVRDARRIDARLGWLRTERQTCTVVGPRPFCVTEASTLFVTEDGGATWSRRAERGLGPPDRAVAMARDGAMLRVTSDGRLLRSANAGRDWVAVPGFTEPFAAAGGPWSIVWLDSDHVWLRGQDRVWRSRDGGRTWQSAPSVELPHGGLLDVQALGFADPLHGWAVGSDAHLMSTRDGGATWQLQTTDASFGFYTVFALDAQRVWLGGHQGVMATGTGGR